MYLISKEYEEIYDIFSRRKILFGVEKEGLSVF